jgi:hypothetical protein
MQLKLIEVQQNKVVKSKRSNHIKVVVTGNGWKYVQPTLWRAILVN